MTTAAREVRSFQVTIPAGTPASAPYTADVSFPPRELLGVHWKVPPGPSGLMGWRLTMSGGLPVIPTGGGWVITDGDSDTWEVESQPDSGAWEVTGYNTDIYDHSVYLDFLVALTGVPATVLPAQPISAAGLSQMPAASVPAGPPAAAAAAAGTPPPAAPAGAAAGA